MESVGLGRSQNQQNTRVTFMLKKYADLRHYELLKKQQKN